MTDTVVVYGDNTRIAANNEAVSPAETALVSIVERCFEPDREGGAWLLYRLDDCHSLAVIAGPFTPVRKAGKHLRRRGLGLAPIDLAYAPLVGGYGVEALQWNGKAVVASRAMKERMQ